MTITRRRLLTGVTGLGLGCLGLTGCQTYPAGFGGMTTPSPHYLKHYPQYFAPDPPFPLQRELDAMQDPEGLAKPGPRSALAPLAPLPPVAPPTPVAAPGAPGAPVAPPQPGM
ncbi:MAG: hypothetical protein ACRC7O_14515 [Fimbriiglobus sp.]